MRVALLSLLLLVSAGCVVNPVGTPAIRTELYCGFSTPRADVTEREFRQFLDEVVTPRFPDGYTVEPAEGRWKGAQEASRIIVIVHPETDDASGKIEAIRREYKFRFDQQSVLRVDGAVRASF